MTEAPSFVLTYPTGHEYDIVIAATSLENAARVVATSNTETGDYRLERNNHNDRRTFASKSHIERMSGECPVACRKGCMTTPAILAGLSGTYNPQQHEISSPDLKYFMPCYTMVLLRVKLIGLFDSLSPQIL